MNLIRQFAEHRLAPNLLMIIMLLAGLWAVRVMPTQLDPANNFPLVFVDIAWRGASAEDVETLLTRPIEQQLRTAPGLRELTSRSQEGFVSIQVQFAHGTDLTSALDDVKQRVANIRNLPPQIEPPVVRRLLDVEPIASVIVTGNGDVEELIPLVRTFERELYARGVEMIRFVGMPRMEIALQVSSRELSQLHLSLDDLARQVAAVSADVPAGTVGIGQSAQTLRSLDQARSAEDFAALPISSVQGVVHLGDIATIEKRPERGQPVVMSAGQPAIEMVLFRRTDTDALLGNRIVDGWINDVLPTLPRGVTVEKAIDVWKLLGAQLQMIWTNGWTGLLLVLLVLYVFLNTRVALWVAAGIPVALLLGLAGFHLVFGYGISIIALLGLIMSLGIVVDDAIVVAEDVVTRHDAGASALDAATLGSQRMWIPVMSSSMTTLAAFLPLLIIGGVMGDMILALPTILLCVIVASLIECFLVLPGHLKGSLGKPSRLDAVRWRVRFNEAFQRFRDGPVLNGARYAMANPGSTVALSIGGTLIAAVLMISNHVPFNLVMGFDFEAIAANVQFAASARADERARFIRHLEQTLEETNEATGSVNIEGTTTRLNQATFAEEDVSGAHYAAVHANYAFEEDRNVAPATFVARWRDRIQQPPYVEALTVDIDGGKNGGQADVTLVLRGHDLMSVKAGAQALKAAMAAYPGVTNVVDDVPFGREQVIFSLTPRGRGLALTTADVGAQLRAAYSGARVQIFNANETEVEVRFLLPDAEQDDLGRLQQFPVKTPAGTLVPLGNIADLYYRRGVDVIRHTDTQMAVRVSADIDSDVANAMTLIESLKANDLPPILEAHNLSFGLGGKSEQDAVILETMTIGGALTLLMIYLILAWTFSSWLWPVAIMMAIPFGFTGAVFGHWITGWDVGAMSLLGFFALTGIVVNDSIVLISVFKEQREHGVPVKEALEVAITSRFRAVMLTSLTTIAGLASLMFETSTLAFMVAPIAVTLCFGLGFATALVLFVIPALILLLENFASRVQSFRRTAWTATPTISIDPKGDIA